MRNVASCALMLVAALGIIGCSDDDDSVAVRSETGAAGVSSGVDFATPTGTGPLPNQIEPPTPGATAIPVVTSANGLPFYEDATGLAFNYPAGWRVTNGYKETPVGQSPPPGGDNFYTVIVTSSDPAAVAGGGAPPFGKADIYIEPLASSPDPRAELERQMAFGSELSAVEEIVIGGEPGVRQLAKSSQGPWFGVAIASYGDRRFTIVALADDGAGVRESLDLIADSMRFE